MPSRRKFLTQVSLTAGSVLGSSLGNDVFAILKNKPSEQINIGVIGVNGMGWSDMSAMLKIPNVTLTALCDVDKNVLDKRMTDLGKLNVESRQVKTFGDHRKMLEMKNLDAVIIGTPDHWHCLQAADACQAGKDIYVEKPIGNSIEECRLMMAAQKKYNRVAQAGQWQRSQQHFQDAMDFIDSGKLGNIRTVKVWCYVGWKQPIPIVPDSPVPVGVDYERWLGPAAVRPFNKNRFHSSFRWFWDYAGGVMTDWGVHLIDYALLGMKAELPKSVTAIGGNFAAPSSPAETPDTLCALYEFDKFNLVWDHAIGIRNGLFNKGHGIAFIGNHGTLELDRDGWEVIEESKSPNKVAAERQKSADNGLDKHMENFVSVIRSRKMEELKCPLDVASHVATVSQMGNIAFRSGRKLHWDRSTQKFSDEAINDKYFAAPYHNGYALPKI